VTQDLLLGSVACWQPYVLIEVSPLVVASQAKQTLKLDPQRWVLARTQPIRALQLASRYPLELLIVISSRVSTKVLTINSVGALAQSPCSAQMHLAAPSHAGGGNH
jgi:hypothetical protein